MFENLKVFKYFLGLFWRASSLKTCEPQKQTDVLPPKSHLIKMGKRGANICLSLDDFSLQNSFEVYGADFVLTEDFKPWLIEVNSSPCLALNTVVKTKLCTSLFDDIIKGMCFRSPGGGGW